MNINNAETKATWTITKGQYCLFGGAMRQRIVIL